MRHMAAGGEGMRPTPASPQSLGLEAPVPWHSMMYVSLLELSSSALVTENLACKAAEGRKGTLRGNRKPRGWTRLRHQR